MNFLVISDLHINDWTEYSQIDEYGRPSRLTNYLELAREIVRLGLDKKIHAILVAGDVSQSATQRPRVNEIIIEFFTILSELRIPILVTCGQHDIDTKTSFKNNNFAHNCILAIIEPIPHVSVFYESNRDHVLDEEGREISIFIRPWKEHFNLELDDPVDIIMTHGIVSGTSNPQGHMFSSGFSMSELAKKSKITIVGDVHNGVCYKQKSGDRFVLIPGAPTQNTYSDASNCGIWTFKYNAGEGPEAPIFYSIHDLLPGVFHRFVYDDSNLDGLNVH